VADALHHRVEAEAEHRVADEDPVGRRDLPGDLEEAPEIALVGVLASAKRSMPSAATRARRASVSWGVSFCTGCSNCQ
jgi:hypothetical protein